MIRVYGHTDLCLAKKKTGDFEHVTSDVPPAGCVTRRMQSSKLLTALCTFSRSTRFHDVSCKVVSSMWSDSMVRIQEWVIERHSKLVEELIDHIEILR